MKENLTVHVFQPDVTWEDPTANKAKYENWLRKMDDPQKSLVIFPETFLTGFSMNTKLLGEGMDSKSVGWMKDMASKYQKILAGSHIIRDGDKFFNRFLFSFPDGRVEVYDKRHLFRMGEEHNHFAKGESRKIIGIGNWRIMPVICYDIRFPVWIRNRNDYDVLICIANWPAVRQPVWNNLLVTRAIENMSYVIGVNRVGKDGNQIQYVGGSQCIDPKGNYMLKSDDQEAIFTFVLEKNPLENFRKKFPVHLDADDFIIK
jgi:omega-amidase